MFPDYHHSWGHMPKPPRTLVLCFDGTADEFDEDNSNVVRFFGLLKKDDEDSQLCYYQAGVGTYFKPGVVSPFLRWAATALDLAVAWYLDTHVMDGYRFLMQNYRKGDKICLFGFSRGAYIARALAGFLQKCGLLLKDNEEQLPFAWKLYKRIDKKGIELAMSFKQTYCRDVRVEFVGCWDTVASVGVLTSRTLPFTNSNKGIKTFRHALSLDEHRAKFRPNLWHRPAPVTSPRRMQGEMKNPDGPLLDRTKTPPSPSPRSSEQTEGLGLLLRPPSPLTASSAPASVNGRSVSPFPPAPFTFTNSVSGTSTVSSSKGKEKERAPPPERPSISEQPTVEEEILSEDGSISLAPPPAPNRSASPRELRPSTLRWASTSAKLTRLLRMQRSRVVRGRQASHSDTELPDLGHNGEATYVGGRSPGNSPASFRSGRELPDTEVLEVWFPGTHADVGGGSLPNGAKRSLSNITLRWMVREVTSSQCGIIFDQRALSRAGVLPSLLGSPTKAGRREKELDQVDMYQPIVDQLSLRRPAGFAWWMGEFMPTIERWQDPSGQWKRKVRLNLGRGRDIPESVEHPRFHFTVRERREKEGYMPRAKWREGSEKYVE